MKQTAEIACSKLLQQMGIMLHRAPFIMESFMKEQTDGGHVLNMTVRYSPESSQQRGGKKARERRSKRRELERTGQTSSSQETSLENGEIQEVRNGSGTDENWFIQDINQSDDSDIRNRHAGQHLLPERHHLDGRPVTSHTKSQNTRCVQLDGRPVTSQNRDQNRLVKVKSDTENYGHLFGLLKTRIFNLEEKLTNLESDRQKDQEQMSRSQQKERIKSRQTDKQTKVFKRTFCHYCHKYCSSLHYCETKKIFRHEDSFLLMILEGENEENLSIVASYNNKFTMRDHQETFAEDWIKKRHDEELVLAEERQHMISKTKPRPLDESPIITEETKGELVLKWKNSKALGPNLPNHYLVEYAKHPGENWNELAIIEKKPFNQIELKDFRWEPYLEFQFRVSVFNRHGISPASKCTMSTDMNRHRHRYDIMTYNDKMTRLNGKTDFQGQLSLECNQVILTFPNTNSLHNGHFRQIPFFQSGNIFHLTRIFTYLNWGKHKQLNNRVSRLTGSFHITFVLKNMSDKTTLWVLIPYKNLLFQDYEYTLNFLTLLKVNLD